MIEAPVNSCDRRAYSASVAVVGKDVVGRFAAFFTFLRFYTLLYMARPGGCSRSAWPARCRDTTRSPAHSTMRRGDEQSALSCAGALADARLSGRPAGRGGPASTAPGRHTVRAPRPLESGGRR